MRPIARWLVRRELRAHRQLQGHAFVPSILGSLDALGFFLEYRPGEMLSRSLRTKLPATFLTELRAAIEQMHAHGVAHLDLRHRSNILAGSDGHPVLLDFASAICFHPGSFAARWILPQLARLDLRALQKWEHKLRPPGDA
jgi:serine/threonine protein kinase